MQNNTVNNIYKCFVKGLIENGFPKKILILLLKCFLKKQLMPFNKYTPIIVTSSNSFLCLHLIKLCERNMCADILSSVFQYDMQKHLNVVKMFAWVSICIKI